MAIDPAEKMPIEALLREAFNRLSGTWRTVTYVSSGGNFYALNGDTNGNVSVLLTPSASGTGLSMFENDAIVATAVSVKSSAGMIFGYHIQNPNSTDAFLHFYNIASGSVVVGTSTRMRSLWIPANGAVDSNLSIGRAFATAISIAATTTLSGSIAPSTGLLVNIDYI